MTQYELPTRSEQDLELVRAYYCSQRSVGDAEMSIYEIWENGRAFHDSVTPSIFSPEYRSHIVLKILSLTPDKAQIFSLGCGNGFVEGDLVRRNRGVTAIDCNEDAIRLTRQKGVDAFTADFFTLQARSVADADVVYADGLIGHLFHPEAQLKPVLSKLKALNLKHGSLLVFSNDSPRDPSAAFAPHDKVKDFWFVSKDYLQESLSSFGFAPLEGYCFPYYRPVTGLRNRTICIARAP